LYLAAADDVTRQRCVRIIKAASAGAASSSLPDIALFVALTSGLLVMKSGAAIKAVLAALGVTIDHPSLKAARFTPLLLKAVGLNAAAFRAAGFDWSILNAVGFSAVEVKAAGCDLVSALKAGYTPPALKSAWLDLAAFRAAGFGWSIVRVAGFSAAEVKAAGCDPASAQSAGYDVLSLVAAYGYDAIDLSSCILVSALRCAHARSILHLPQSPSFFAARRPQLVHDASLPQSRQSHAY
jgi:hypothetical protein